MESDFTPPPLIENGTIRRRSRRRWTLAAATIVIGVVGAAALLFRSELALALELARLRADESRAFRCAEAASGSVARRALERFVASPEGRAKVARLLVHRVYERFGDRTSDSSDDDLSLVRLAHETPGEAEWTGLIDGGHLQTRLEGGDAVLAHLVTFGPSPPEDERLLSFDRLSIFVSDGDEVRFSDTPGDE